MLLFAVYKENAKIWDLLVAHSQNITNPAKPALTEGKVQSGRSSMSQHFLIGDLLLPSYFKNTTKAS